jgi:hypothetical protein
MTSGPRLPLLRLALGLAAVGVAAAALIYGARTGNLFEAAQQLLDRVFPR